MLKKTFYYNFFPSKYEEDTIKASKRRHIITQILVEIRDLYPQPPPMDPNNPWPIRKYPTSSDIVTGKLMLSHSEMFNHIFRHWPMDMANYVVMGNRLPVEVRDVTDANNPIRYRSENAYLEKGSHEFYVLGWMDLVQNRFVNPGDGIGLSWDPRSAALHLKLLLKGM